MPEEVILNYRNRGDATAAGAKARIAGDPKNVMAIQFEESYRAFFWRKGRIYFSIAVT